MQRKKCKQKEKLKPLSSVTPEQMREAMKIASYWLTDQLEGHTEKGAFSEMNLLDNPRKYFLKRAYMILKDPECKWKWKEDMKLSTLMINVIRSEMGHELRKYIAQGEPDVVVASSLERDGGTGAAYGSDEWNDANSVLEVDKEQVLNGFDMQTEMEMLEELEREESMRDQGIKIARTAAKETGDAMLIKYVELVFELPDYRAISKRMKISMVQVKELEAELIAIFANKKNNVEL